MKPVRRAAYATFAVACLHLVFGAIVRITGSGMGCGPHWPKCYGYWFPPMSRPDLVIEVTHRYLASVLLLSLIVLVATAWRHRAAAGVGGRGGVLRAATTALGLGFGAALLGAVTVKFQNAPLATLAHWTVAMSLVAAVAASVVRAGGLGGTSAKLGGATMRARRGTLAAAGLALVAVVMGGLTAKTPGAPVACSTFLPFCTPNPDVAQSAVHVQVTHRWIAVLLILHLVGLFFGFRKRREAAVVRRAGVVALSLGILQLLVAGAMIGMHLPPVLRSLHEATGVSIWISCFVLALLSRIASDPTRVAGAGEVVRTPPAMPLGESGTVRVDGIVDGRSAHATAIVADAPVVAMGAAVSVADHSVEAVVSSAPLGSWDAAEPFAMRNTVDERGVLASLAIAAVGASVASEAARDVWASEALVPVKSLDAVAAGASRGGDDVETVEIAEIIAGIAAVGAESGQETWEAEYWVAEKQPSEDVETVAESAASSDVVEGLAIAEFGLGDVDDVAVVELGDAKVVVDAVADAEAEGAAIAMPAHAAGEAGERVTAIEGTGSALDVDGTVESGVDGAVESGVDGAVESGVDGAVESDVEARSGAGGPPQQTNTTESAELHHQSAAPRTIFDAHASDDGEAAALLAALGPDPFDDADDDLADLERDDRVLSLDEEFSLQAADAESGEDGEADAPLGAKSEEGTAVAIPAGVASPGSVIAPASAATYHSVFVIVARGAGF